MSSEAALNLSVPELLRVLNEKLGLECTRAREIRLPPVLASTISLEAEIKSLEARAHEILNLIPSLRNLVQPVNRLPPETLSRIAQFVGKNAMEVRSIIPLTHVCRYWRESIVSTPGNWTLISNKWIRLTELSLGRCRAAPLELLLDVSDVREISALTALIMPYMQSVAALDIYDISTIGELVQKLPGPLQSMPNLRTLSLSSSPRLNVARQDVSSDPFGQSTLALTDLSLFSLPLFPSLRRLTTLTNLTLHCYKFDLPIDTFLDFLEANRALENAFLNLTLSAFQNSRRRVGTVNRLKSLSIWSNDAADTNALISRIPLRKGCHLEINPRDQNANLTGVLSGIPVTHFSNLQSPTAIDYHPDYPSIGLFGPNGSLKFYGDPHFAEFPIIEFTNIKAFRLVRYALEQTDLQTYMVFPSFALRALETLAVEREMAVSHLLSALFADPSAFPSLKTLAFLDCRLDEACMKALTKFASDRKNTASAWLYRVVVVSGLVQNLPSISSIDTLGEHVPVVDARIGKKLPADLLEEMVGGLGVRFPDISPLYLLNLIHVPVFTLHGWV